MCAEINPFLCGTAVPERPRLDSFAAHFAAAKQHHRDGNLNEAVAGYRQALAQKPNDPNVLLLLGFLLSQGIDPLEGEAHLLTYIAIGPDNVAAYHTLGKISQARDDDESAIVFFQKAVAVELEDSPSWNDLGSSLHRLGRLPDAVTAFSNATICAPAWALPHHNLGNVHYDMGELALAEAEFRAALAIDPNLHDTHSMLSLTLDRLHRREESEFHADEFARLAPLVVNPCQHKSPKGRALLLLGAGMCNARTDYLFSQSRYETVIAYIRPSDPAQASLLSQLPPCDFVFSAIADPDRAAPIFAEAASFCEKVGGVIFNRPDHRIERTRRDRLPTVLAGIPNIVIPEMRRLPVAELQQMATQSGAMPRELLVRPCGFHEGRYFERIAAWSDLGAYLQKVACPEYYVSPYHDCKNADGYFRKYRFIFIDRKVYPYHLAIDTQWLVHRFRAEMSDHPWMLAEEEAFLADYRQVFPPALCDAVQAIATAVDLDFAGIDCSITPDGRLLVFESNATMMVHLNETGDHYAYKHRYIPRIADAIDEMVGRRRG